uniref:probable U3 small nucleolar RNA-associated protein 11 n=1 Tax=Myxine glutinosa TaxID=7769 RepID=UPI00358E4DD5
MSSFKKATKSFRRIHQERSQPKSRKNLGLLEKKKDYKIRARHWHRKQDLLLALRRKAEEKNPDEFYYKMTSTKLQDGVHETSAAEPTVTEDQQKLMKTQDICYVQMKCMSEAKKIERLKGELHFLESEEESGRHTFFVDTKDEVSSFDLASRLDTDPELIPRIFNRPKLHTLQTRPVVGSTDPRVLKRQARTRAQQYHLLEQHVAREAKLLVTQQKIQTRKDLLDKRQKVKVKPETKSSPAIYRFKLERQR